MKPTAEGLRNLKLVAESPKLLDMFENKLSAETISKDLPTRFTGRKIIYYPTLATTMETGRKEALGGAPEGTAIFVGEQTGGKGRLKRSWVTPGGNIAVSILFYPGVTYLPHMIMIASLAVARTIEAVTGLITQIKWTNDVLINGKKVCGILIENEVKGKRVDYVNIGIGLNVNLKVADYPEIAPFATSLSDELGGNVSLVDVARRLLIEIEDLYFALPEGDSVYEEWKRRLVTIGKRVRARWDDSLYEGIAESVARDGSLLLRQEDGKLVRIVAGDVTLRE